MQETQQLQLERKDFQASRRKQSHMLCIARTHTTSICSIWG